MPPVPPSLIWTLGAVGAALLVKLAAKEWQRVNAELERVRRPSPGQPQLERLPKLRRDPVTGVYRPHG